MSDHRGILHEYQDTLDEIPTKDFNVENWWWWHATTIRSVMMFRAVEKYIYIYVRYAKSVIKTRMEFQNEIIDDSGRIIFRE